jgi:glycosyltransferase involved in cell wall biosynthesis
LDLASEQYLDAHAGPGVCRVGPVYGDAKFSFLSSIDLLLFPSKYPNEAQPVVIWESLSVGTPVVSTDVGAIAEQATHGGVELVTEADRYTDTVLDLIQSGSLPSRDTARSAFDAAARETDKQIDGLLQELDR